MKPAVLFLLLIFTACNAQKKSPENGLTLVARDSYSGTEQAETLIIKDAKSLKKFYSRLNRTRKPGLSVPDIDFSKEMIVVRCSGTTDNGAMPQLYVMGETQKEMVLGVRKTDKKSNSSAVTTPFAVYRMPLTEKEVVVRN